MDAAESQDKTYSHLTTAPLRADEEFGQGAYLSTVYRTRGVAVARVWSVESWSVSYLNGLTCRCAAPWHLLYTLSGLHMHIFNNQTKSTTRMPGTPHDKPAAAPDLPPLASAVAMRACLTWRRRRHYERGLGLGLGLGQAS